MKTIHDLIMNLPGLTGTGVAIMLVVSLLVLITLIVFGMWIARVTRKLRWQIEVADNMSDRITEKSKEISSLLIKIDDLSSYLQRQQTAYESRIKSLNEQIKQATDKNRHDALACAMRHKEGIEKAKEYYRFLQGKA